MVKDTILYLTTSYLNGTYFIYILYQNIYLKLFNFASVSYIFYLQRRMAIVMCLHNTLTHYDIMYSVKNLHSNSVQSKGVKNL